MTDPPDGTPPLGKYCLIWKIAALLNQSCTYNIICFIIFHGSFYCLGQTTADQEISLFLQYFFNLTSYFEIELDLACSLERNESY